MDDYTRRKLLGTGRLTGDAPLDPTSGAVPISSDLQRDIHCGCAWELSYIVTDIAPDGVVLLQFNTGADGVRVRRLDVWSDAGIAHLELFRNPTLTDGTTAIPITNLCHDSDIELPEGIAAFSDPSEITDVGELYFESLVGAGREDKEASSKAARTERDVETMLAPNTKHLVRLTNLNGLARSFSIGMIFCA